MKLRVVCIGKNKSKNLAEVCGDFAQRIRHVIPLDVIEIKDPRIANEKKRIEAEGEKIMTSVSRTDFVVALDPAGRSHSSKTFSEFLDRHMNQNPRDVVFVVGGYGGLSDEVKKRADLLWSLSELTFSHDLARAVLLEQLYRALSIIHHHPYAR